MTERDDAFERVAGAQRTTKAEASAEGIGNADSGAELPARSYPDETGVADLGVDEPVVMAEDTVDGSNPTGSFAGETLADRRAEDAVRRVLEDGFPESRGRWKRGGRVPD